MKKSHTIRTLSQRNRLALLMTTVWTAASLINAPAADIIKENNVTNLNLSTAWVGGVVPGGGDVAVWNNTVTGGLTNALGGNLTFKGVRIADPAGTIQLSAGSTLTVGTAGVDLSVATQDLVLSNAVAIAGGFGFSTYQKWPVAAGRTLNLRGSLTKPGVGAPVTGANSALVEFSTTGTTQLTNVNRLTLQDSQTNPYGLWGANDWAGTDASGIVGPSTYTVAAGSMTASAVNDIQGNTSVASVAVEALRFNDPTPYTVTITGNNTHTARGILVTANCGGGAINGGNIRPNRVSAGAAAPTAFPIIQNSAADFTIGSTFSVASSSTPVHVLKYGKGNLILTGSAVGLTGNGGLTVFEGTVTLNGSSLAAATNVVNQGKLAVRSGTTMASPATIFNNGGTNSINVIAANGVVTITNATFAAGATALEFVYGAGVAPSSSTAPLFAAGTLTANATINVSVLSGGLTTGQFPLVKYTSLGGAGFAAFNLLTLPPRVVGTLSNNVANSSIDLVVTTVNQPVTWAAGNGIWDLNNTANWNVLAAPTTYQQIANIGDSVLFEDTLSIGAPLTITLDQTLAPASVTVSAAKNYTITGTGNIAGIGGITKAGAGTLTLQTTNATTGGLFLNGGTTVFSTLANLGAAGITFGGGTLQYNGNTDDISVRTVTLASGGGAIDVGAGEVAFTKPIGNNGAGGLTKLGSGTLKLIGTNLYSGVTTVSAGTLWLSPDGTPTRIPNSSAIVIAGGATLDVATQGGLTLSSSASQVLRGTGSVNGDLTAPASTTISPADTNVVGTLTLTNSLTVDGATLVFDVSTTSRDRLNVGGTLNLNSGTIKILASGLTNGSYTLITHGGLGGLLANLALDYSQAGKSSSLSDATPGEIRLVIDSAANDNLKWAGVGTDWDLIGSLNWLNGVNPWGFTNGSTATFDDSGAAVSSVNLTATVKPGAITVSNTVDYTFNDGAGGLGKVGGATGLTKSGAGTLVVLAANNNSGPTVINAGTIQVGNFGSTGDLGSGNITNNGALVFQQTDSRSVPGIISGSGSLAHQGGVTLTLAANNPYSGPTTIGSGATLALGNSGATGTLPNTSAVTNDGSLVLDNTANWTLAAPVTGAGSITKSNSNTIILSGVNTYTGNTIVRGGTLRPATTTAWPGGDLTVDAGTFDVNGLSLNVASLAGTPFAAQRIVNNSGSATNSLSIGNNDAAGTFNGVIADNDGTGGKISLVKVGTGAMVLGGSSTYTGGTIISNGLLNVRAVNGILGLVRLRGGNLNSVGDKNFSVSVEADGTIDMDTGVNRNQIWTGTISGSSNLTMVLDTGETITWNTASQLAGFSGTINLTNDNGSSGFFRFGSAPNGSSLARFELNPGIQIRNTLGGTFNLGALSGTAGSSLNGVVATAAFVIGDRNENTLFSGDIIGAASLTKVGTGRLTLDGTNSVYTGNTVVSNGVLALAGLAAPTNSATVQVVSGGVLDVVDLGVLVIELDELNVETNRYVLTNSILTLGNGVAQTLAGDGVVRGSASLGVAGTLSPGNNGIGNLTVTNAVTLGGTTLMQLNRTNTPASNDKLTAASVAAGGTLTVSNLGPELQAGDNFKLFSVPVSGSFATLNLPQTFIQNGATNNYVWTNKLAFDGSVEVVTGFVPVDTTPTNLTYSVSGNALTLTWPASRTGWRLQSQTNNLEVGLSTNWSTVPGSATTNSVTLSVEPTSPTVFFRMVYP